LVVLGSAFFLAVATINLATTLSDKLRNDDFIMVLVLPVYLIFLSFLVINAYLLMLGDRKLKLNSVLLLIGAISFFISDNVLGRSRFADFVIFDIKHMNSVVIMATYYLGQYLIAMTTREMEVETRPLSLISSNTD
jgi:hypothetical protein